MTGDFFSSLLKSLILLLSDSSGLLLSFFLILAGSLIGTFQSLNEELIKSQKELGYQPPRIKLSKKEYFSRFQPEIVRLSFLNICFSLILYFLLVRVIFPLLEWIFSDNRIQLLIAFTLALAVAKRSEEHTSELQSR